MDGSENKVAAAFIADELPCRRCGYDLRGLASDGRCPECGTPVGISRRSGLLWHADPTWVGGLSLGARLTFWGSLLLAMLGVRELFGPGGAATDVIQLIGGGVGNGLWFIGVWLVTVPDPSRIGEAHYGHIRRVVRWAMPFSIAGELAGEAHRSLSLPGAVRAAAVTTSTVSDAADVVLVIAVLLYVRGLTCRTQDLALSARADTLARWVGRPLAGLMLFGTIANAGWPAVRTAFNVAAGLCGLPLLVTGPLYLLFWSRLVKRLRAEASTARRTWRTRSLAAVPRGP